MEPTATPGGAYPAVFTFDAPEKVANWRPLVNWLLAIPHFVVLYFLRIVSQAVGFLSWLVIIFTGSLPEGFANIQTMYLRYEQRVYTFVAFLRTEYPPFTFGMTAADPGDDQRVRVEFQPELTERNRLTVAFRIILAIPHFVVLVLLAVAAAVVTIIAFFAVLFTGHWPDGMRTF